MPSPLEIIFGRKPKAISINRGPYVMEMADGENAEITMYGEIVERHPKHWWTGEPLEGDFIVQDEFLRDLENLSGAKTLTIRMHSIGGDAGVSILIHNRLRDLSAKGMLLTCIVDGVAMSGGSLIMCACDNVEVNPSSLVMIHKAAISLFDSCNADDLRKHASALDAWDKAQVSIYKRKAPGLSDMTISNMMAKTTYMTGTEAVEKGFADKLLENAEPLHIAASADGRSLFVRGRQFYLTPGMFAPDTIPTVTPEAAAPVEANKNQPAQTGSEGGKTMAKNLEELRAENAELAEALLAEARAAVSASGAAVPAPAPAPAVTPAPAPQSSGGDDPAQAERKRIQEIDALAGLFDTETINAAKYGDHPCTAQEMVYQAAQKASQQGGTFLAALEADTAASGAQDVGAANGAGSDGAGGTGGPDSPPGGGGAGPSRRQGVQRAEEGGTVNMKELVKKVGERGQDNLIAGLFPRALIVPVSIVAGAGELARGTVLSRKEDGTCEVMAAGGTPAYVLADPVDASGTEAVAAVAYRSGNFNPDAVIVAEGYTLTAADKDTLRKYDIIFTRVLPE